MVDKIRSFSVNFSTKTSISVVSKGPSVIEFPVGVLLGRRRQVSVHLEVLFRSFLQATFGHFQRTEVPNSDIRQGIPIPGGRFPIWPTDFGRFARFWPPEVNFVCFSASGGRQTARPKSENPKNLVAHPPKRWVTSTFGGFGPNPGASISKVRCW